MSKESQVFSMSDAEKIAKVLEIKGINLYDANRKLGLGQGTLHKIIQRKSGIHESTTHVSRGTSGKYPIKLRATFKIIQGAGACR